MHLINTTGGKSSFQGEPPVCGLYGTCDHIHLAGGRGGGEINATTLVYPKQQQERTTAAHYHRSKEMDTKENWLLCKLLQTLYSSNSHSAERTALYSTEKPKSKIQELLAQYKVRVPLSHLKSCFEAVFPCALHRLKLHLTTHILSSCLPAEQSGFNFPASARVEMMKL